MGNSRGLGTWEVEKKTSQVAWQRTRRTGLALAIAGLALVLRLGAAASLPIDYDEDDYLRAAQLYARIIRDRAWERLPQVVFNKEHPPLAKLAFGWAIAGLPPAPEIPARALDDPAATSLPQPHLWRARVVSAVLGALTVGLLAWLNPLAGLFLAVHTLTIKYTSLAMLEALPALTSALAVLAYARAMTAQARRTRHRWLVLSALALGLTAASKYVYTLVGIAIGLHWLLVTWGVADRHREAGRRPGLGAMLGWGGLALSAFCGADFYLWPAPVSRLQASLGHHLGVSQSFLVEVMDLPAYQPLVWLFSWAPGHRHVIPVGPDPLIAVLALVGLPALWRKRPLYVIWIGVALGFLFLWPTKWPQYVLTLTVPWAMAAAMGVEAVGPWMTSFRRRGR
jgi:hypothetical protein